jgi:alanine dehydrogenase
MTLWLNVQDIASVLKMNDAIQSVENAFASLASGQVTMPQRVGIGMPQYNGGGAVMPAYVGGDVDRLGVKVVTFFFDNPKRGLPTIQATMILLDPHTGTPLAIMDGAYLTALRTGAVSGVATKYLARENSTVVIVFGAGVQARQQLVAMCAVRPIQRAFVVDVVADAAEKFARELSVQLNIEITHTTDVRAAVEQSDIIVAASSSHNPVLKSEWLKPGTHINGIGSHLPTTRELDTETVRRAKLVVDQTAACLAEAGDIILAIKEGAITEAHIHAQLGEVVTRAKPGRTDDFEITIFKSVGLAIQDVAVATQAYRLAQAAGLGQILKD